MSVYISLALSNSWEMPLLCVEQLCTNNAENGTFQLVTLGTLAFSRPDRFEILVSYGITSKKDE